MVYAAAVAATLFYAANVPLCFAFFVRVEGGVRMGLGFRPFLRGAALARARAGEMPKPSPGKSAVRLPAKFWFFAALELLRRIEAVRVCARLGTGDAASTALLCGALQGIFSCLGRADIAPAFEAKALEASGIVEIRAGNIIRAMAAAGLRARPWERKKENGKASD